MTSLPALLEERTTRFAVRIVALVRTLPKADEGRIMRKQWLRAGTSIAADHRAVCRARSRAESIGSRRPPFSSLNRITEQHRNGQRAHAARNRAERPRHFSHARMNVADDDRASPAEFSHAGRV